MEFSFAADDQNLDLRQHRYQCRLSLLRFSRIGKRKCRSAQKH